MKKSTFLVIFSLLASHVALAAQGSPYDDKGKRDPFFPLVDKRGRYLFDIELPYSSDVLKLSGILWDPQGRSSALINNEVVKTGESISGFTIKNITRDSVTIFKGDKEFILRLSEQEGE